jgi:hypothetical protein
VIQAEINASSAIDSVGYIFLCVGQELKSIAFIKINRNILNKVSK